MKNRMRVQGILLCLCLFLAMLVPVPAAGANNTAGLLLKYEHAGAEFRIYQVTDATGRKTGAFESYEISLDNTTNAERQEEAIRLAKLAAADAITPTASGKTANGELRFAGLSAGWYLVCGEALKAGSYTYEPAPFLAYLTAGKSETAEVKADQIGEGTDPTKPTDPTDPTDPTGPTEPSKPTEPTNPDDPTKPSNPDEPTSPDDPTKPSNPDEPTNPDDPSNPQNPTNPSGTDNPTKPNRPSGSDEPDDSGSSGGSTSSRPVKTDGVGPGFDQTRTETVQEPLSSFTDTEAPVDVITLEEGVGAGVVDATLPQIPKLGDLGLFGYGCGMAVSLMLLLVLLVLRRRLCPDGEQ